MDDEKEEFDLINIPAAGGVCLALYVMQPHSPYASWLPFAGVAFVCLPWLFWMLTCFYRVVSRSCGFRDVGIDRNGRGGRGAGGGGGAGAGGPIVANAADNNMAIEARAEERPPVRSPESDARRRAQFEAILGLEEQDDHGSSQGKKKQKKSNSSSSHSSNDSSTDSHESEMALTSSMTS
ncbi:uncharacterized protein LOC121249254 [Juglans microcarpa x Juglans regia]|uniref:uncharacterized protein LOC121249254 n=1 Tax=Juglans microcarpa x Juglans regia TaxID=2249226 RepID=UPI001B7EAD37|nr:uncharacterized protein LOC121249254 [Juglans microcarpa x Juglans regia]